MALSLAPAAVAQTGVKLDRDLDGKYPQKARGARRLVRRAGRKALAREVARGEV